MLKQLGREAAGFDLTGFFQRLDAQLVDSGEPWDRKWVWDAFHDATSDLFGERRPTRHQSHRPWCPTALTPEEEAARAERQRDADARDAAAEALLEEIVELMPVDEFQAIGNAKREEYVQRFPAAVIDDAMLRLAVMQHVAETEGSRERRE